MSPTPIIDSHIHLWPQSAANTQGHGWMEPGELLTKQHILSDYNKAAKQNPGDDSDVHVQGVVYVETDRRLEPKDNQTLEQWALQPIEEIRFLRSIVEGEYGERDSAMLQGIVLWAPVDQGLEVFEQWLRHAERVAGEETWSRVKGFRFLLQGITDEAKFYALVRSTGFSRVLKAHASNDRKFCFDVGVDQHSGGVWQLEAIADAMERAHDIVDTSERVTFILNHFCKPDLTIGPSATQTSSDFKRWCACIKQFSSFPMVYMKLSGAFSELSQDRVEITSPQEIADRLEPWLDHLFAWFPPSRVMFGSDWPVCNVRGPLVEDSWSVWKDVVNVVMDRRGFSEWDKQRVWSGTASEAYRLGRRD